MSWGSVFWQTTLNIILFTALRALVVLCGCVSTQMLNLPVLEMGGPFPVMVPVPEVRNHISGTALTVRFFVFWLGRLFSHKKVW